MTTIYEEREAKYQATITQAESITAYLPGWTAQPENGQRVATA